MPFLNDKMGLEILGLEFDNELAFDLGLGFLAIPVLRVRTLPPTFQDPLRCFLKSNFYYRSVWSGELIFLSGTLQLTLSWMKMHPEPLIVCS